jgi:cell division protein FtsI (penicillin-binding protein 3)
MLFVKRLFTGKNRRSRTASRKERPAPEKTSLFASVNWDVARLKIVAAVFLSVWGILWCRAWHVQMIEGPRLAHKAMSQHITTELVSGRRGDIYDRNGLALARSVECRSVSVRPAQVTDMEGTALFLARTLDLPLEQVRRQISDPARPFVWIARKIDDSRAASIRKAGLKGVGLSREYERFYPFNRLAGQLLGFVNVDGKGLEGLERSMEEHLGGQPIRQLVQRDAVGRRFYLQAEGQDDPAGKPLKLTLDVQVQFFVEEALERAVTESRAKWAGCLIVDVPTGDILAWGQYPFFNPNTYRDFTPKSQFMLYPLGRAKSLRGVEFREPRDYKMQIDEWRSGLQLQSFHTNARGDVIDNMCEYDRGDKNNAGNVLKKAISEILIEHGHFN